jgi:hypothetical protein
VLRRTYTVYGVCVSLASSASDDALQLGTLVVAVLQHEDGLAGRGRCVGDDRRRAIGRRWWTCRRSNVRFVQLAGERYMVGADLLLGRNILLFSWDKLVAKPTVERTELEPLYRWRHHGSPQTPPRMVVERRRAKELGAGGKEEESPSSTKLASPPRQWLVLTYYERRLVLTRWEAKRTSWSVHWSLTCTYCRGRLSYTCTTTFTSLCMGI